TSLLLGRRTRTRTTGRLATRGTGTGSRADRAAARRRRSRRASGTRPWARARAARAGCRRRSAGRWAASPHMGWGAGRGGGGGRGGHRVRVHGLGHGRLDQAAGGALRSGGRQADIWAGEQGGGAAALVVAGSLRPADANG